MFKSTNYLFLAASFRVICSYRPAHCTTGARTTSEPWCPEQDPTAWSHNSPHQGYVDQPQTDWGNATEHNSVSTRWTRHTVGIRWKLQPWSTAILSSPTEKLGKATARLAVPMTSSSWMKPLSLGPSNPGGNTRLPYPVNDQSSPTVGMFT